VKIPRTADAQVPASVYDLPALLRERLNAALRRNPRFSLRAFAKQLGIDHSTLSQVLRKKRRLSTRAVHAVGKRLGLNLETIAAYIASSRKRLKPSHPPLGVRSFQFDLDTFQMLSVWYHSAILELIHLDGFRTDARWVAKTLGISVEEVSIALQRLLRLGLLEMKEKDLWIDKSGDAEFHTQALSETASNQMHQAVHRLAIEAIRHIPGRQRVQNQMVLALDASELSRLRVLAEEFMEELRSLAAESSKKDDVYQVEVSLFPVTTIKQARGGKNG
jgi:transcriptional regulator with XRE-family HTH domain